MRATPLREPRVSCSKLGAARPRDSFRYCFATPLTRPCAGSASSLTENAVGLSSSPGWRPSTTAYAVVMGRQPGEEDNPTAFSVSEDAEPAQGRVKGVAKQYRKESRGRAAPSFEQLTRGSRNGVARI